MTETRLALVIASYQYEDADLRRLVAPAQDAEALARVLSDPAIGGFKVQTLLNEPSHEVNRAIEIFFADRRRDDLLLLYFSGHGIKDEEGRLYLTTSDTRRNMLRTTAIPATLVNDVMRHSRSRRQVLLLDCCYSGAFARGMVVRADQDISTGEYFKEARGQVVLTASDAIQYSFEGDEIKGEGVRSVFTHTLVRGLETGEADLDGDGNISCDELYDYVYDCVTDKVPQQKPRKWTFDVQGEVIIARNPHPVVKPAELPFELQQSMDDLRPWVREGAVYQLNRLLQSNDQAIALAAHSALTRMSNDDSQQVRTVVNKMLERYARQQREAQAAPRAEPLAVEKVGRLEAHKPVAGRLEQKPERSETYAQQPAAGQMVTPQAQQRSYPSRPAAIRAQAALLLNKAKRTHPGWVLWLEWLLANIAGWAVGWAVGWNVAWYEAWDLGNWSLAGAVAGALAGAVAGTMQWSVLRRRISSAGWWLLASILGWAAAWAASGIVIETWYGLEGWTGAELYTIALAGVLSGALVGIAQWLILRRQVSSAGWWLLASILGWAAAWTAAVFVIADWYGEEWWAGLGMLDFIIQAGVVFGAVGGAITGIALVQLLLRPGRSE